ncbi:MAG: hypothetical protein U0790_12315 [Isosphaeraceae bacterium]
MSDWLMKVIRAEAGRLIELARDDPELRADLRALAEGILDATAAQDASPPVEIPTPAAEGETPQQPSEPEPRLELTLGQRPTAADRPEDRAHHPAQDVPGRGDDLARRCRRKAEGARSAAEREARKGEGRPISDPPAPPDPGPDPWTSALIDGLHWASRETSSTSADTARLEELAGCFEAVAEALDLAGRTEGRSQAFERTLHFLAEAQSALRQALGRVGVADDDDQLAAYEWLRARAARHRVYLRRFMRADDVADPAGWRSLVDRIEQAAIPGRRSPDQERRLEELRGLRETILGEGLEGRDWPAFVDTIEQLIDGGMPPSARELRELLLPMLDLLPDPEDFPPGFRRALREVDRFLATRTTPAPQSATAGPSPEVAEVAGWLSGKSLVLIGGLRRRDAQEAIRVAFGLESVVWIGTREHESFEHFEPMIARPEVALVLLAIRWSSHGFGEVRQLCERHGKPLVRLPGGYGPNQMAAQIVAQCSRQLGRAGTGGA